MIDYVEALRRESAVFAAAVAGAPLGESVPTCPDWTVADLIWHLTEVQHFWASIVSELLQDPEDVPPFDRPEDTKLTGAFLTQSQRLAQALELRNPGDTCWSWHDAGHSVGWVRRRQAHEALIHRVDAERATGIASSLDPALAADGIEEVMRFNLDLDNLPEWAVFEADGSTARAEPTDGSASAAKSWAMRFGRFLGTSPNTGNTYDLAALQIMDAVENPTTVIRGGAADLDLWLWGRGPIDPLEVVGDRQIALKLRETAAESTQ